MLLFDLGQAIKIPCRGRLLMGGDSVSRIGKRMREEEDEVYLDNYHVHKRYLTEVISCSLNGLKVVDSLPDGAGLPLPLISSTDSPTQIETGGISRSVSSFRSHGEDISAVDSPMSDDSDESVGYRMVRGGETPQHCIASVPDSLLASPASPMSPEKALWSNNHIPHSLLRSYTFSHTVSAPVSCTLARQHSADADGRLPPSPSDPCQPADLRRAALLRASQMRVSSPGGGLASADFTGQKNLKNAPSCSFYLTTTQNCELLIDQSSEVLGSPVHGIFPGQGGRLSSRARSLLLDDAQAAGSPSMCDVGETSDAESS